MKVGLPLFQRKTGFSVSNLKCGKPLFLGAQRTAATCRTFSRENAKDWRFPAQKNRKKCEIGDATPPRVEYSAKISLARLFLRVSETLDFGGSRIAVSRTRKPIHLDRSDWLFQVGDLLRSSEGVWDPESSIPSFRIPKFGSVAWLTVADVV